MEYKLIRSKRRTLSVEISGGGLLVRAPMQATDKEIQSFLLQNNTWIEKYLTKARAQRAAAPPVKKLTPEEIRHLADKALLIIPERVKHYAPLVGVTYGRITIRNQRTRWGSCSSKGNLNFNCILMLAPPEVVDSIVVHELCHRKIMNHSAQFYSEVLRVFPDYWKWNKWLKENGAGLLERMWQ